MSEPDASVRDEMTSTHLLVLLRRFAAGPGHTIEDLAHADKRALLTLLLERRGPDGPLEAARQISQLRHHAVIRALTSGSTPQVVLERWMRLERFGHTRNRTRIFPARDARSSLLEHCTLDGGQTHPLDDLFVWGLVITLLELAGFTQLRAALHSEFADNEQLLLYADGNWNPLAALPSQTSRLRVEWCKDRRPPDVERAQEDPLTERDLLVQLLCSDLGASWRLADVARHLARSTRSLQRCLQTEGVTFSELLQRARVAEAMRLMADPQLSLSEIAFCAGFSDQAHFIRLFRRYNDVPPSAYRELIRADAAAELQTSLR